MKDLVVASLVAFAEKLDRDGVHGPFTISFDPGDGLLEVKYIERVASPTLLKVDLGGSGGKVAE